MNVSRLKLGPNRAHDWRRVYECMPQRMQAEVDDNAEVLHTAMHRRGRVFTRFAFSPAQAHEVVTALMILLARK